MSVESAIVSLVVQGDAALGSATDKIEADLTSLERSGKSAETSARSAESAARDAASASQSLGSAMSDTLTALRTAANIAKSISRAAGAEDDRAFQGAGADLIDISLKAANRGAQAFGASGGNPFALIGGVAVGAYEEASELVEMNHKANRKIDEKNAMRAMKGEFKSLEDELIHMAALGKGDIAFTDGEPRDIR